MVSVLERRQLDVEVVIDNIHHGHNASAIFRSVDGFGVGRVHMMYWKERLPRVSKMVSAYSKRWVPCSRWSRPEDCFADVRSRGLRVVATGMGEELPSYLDWDWTVPTALVLGHEKDGCSQEALDTADACVTIPTRGFTPSLNVSVAGAVLLAEIARQRAAAGLLEPRWDEHRQAILDRWMSREETGLPVEP